MRKILFMIPTLTGGGAEKILIDLLQQLDEQEWSIDLLVLFQKGVYYKQLPPNVHLLSSNFPQVRGNIHMMKLIPPQKLYRYFVKDQYDVIVSFLEGPTTRIAAGCPNPETKLINWVHNEFHSLADIGAPYRNIEELLRTYYRFDQTVFVSETAKDALLELIDLPNAKTKVLYNPLNMEKVLKHAVNENVVAFANNPRQLRLITIGRLSYQKGYDRLLNIMAKLIHDDGLDLSLDILGVGEDQKKLQKLASTLNLTKQVNFLGFVEQPYIKLAQADAFVCSSRYEGYSTVVTEATLLGVPVLTTSCSGMSEILGDSGLITENNSEAYYQGLRTVLNNPQTLKQLRKKAQLRGQTLSGRNNAEPIINFLREMSS